MFAHMHIHTYLQTYLDIYLLHFFVHGRFWFDFSPVVLICPCRNKHVHVHGYFRPFPGSLCPEKSTFFTQSKVRSAQKGGKYKIDHFPGP